ncbi:MAG: DnaB-like helicase C-terminal domain-containing protein [Cyanobacteriota bacterium]
MKRTSPNNPQPPIDQLKRQGSATQTEATNPHLPRPVSFPAPEHSAAAFDPSRLDALISQGDWIATPEGPLPVASESPDRRAQLPLGPSPEEWIVHERALLSGVLTGKNDHSPSWGLFRRRIGLRYNEPVPARLWSNADLRLVATEVDAIFRGQRDVRTINAEAIRQDARSRLADGRFRGSLQQLEVALADLLAWAQLASPLDFPIACDLFQTAKARQILYGAIETLLSRQHLDVPIETELLACRAALNEARALTTGYFRETVPVLSARDGISECVALASMPLDQRPKPISTGIPSLDLDMRGGVLPGKGEGTWVLAARSGIGKTTVAIAAAMGLAFNGASVLFLSCELSRRSIAARLVAHYCRRANGGPTPLYGSNDLEGRGRVIAGDDLRRLEPWLDAFANQRRPDGSPMGKLHYQSRFAATIEEISALVEDSKTAHPDLSVVVLDHFHAMGPSPGYGNQTTAELANRAMALKALAGRCDLDILIVAQLNRGAYGSTTGPDVSHLAGTSELERYASAVWLIDRPKSDGPPPPPGLLEVHHGKTRHGQIGEQDINRTLIRIDRAHCFLEADEARVAFVGHHLYPGVAAL